MENKEYHMRILVLGVHAESSDNGNKITSHSNGFKELDKKCNGQLSEILNKTGPFHKPEKPKLLWSSMLNAVTSESRFDSLSIVDLGNKNAEDKSSEGINQKSEDVRCAIVDGVKPLCSCSNFEDIYLDPCENPQCVAEVSNLIVHSYDQLKQKTSKPKSRLHLHKYENIHVIAEIVILAEGQNFDRLLLMETPANHMTPSIFASTISEKFKDTSVKVIARYREWVVSMKMGSFLSVAIGSEESSLKFLDLRYEGIPGSGENVAFVGKGITFDAGGISLESASNMDKMQADMGGAACVVRTILAASGLNLKINVKGFILLTENLPSGKATKPGDVVFAMNEKSIQVDNTDAEGRLVSTDASCYAKKFNPKAVVDTGRFTAKRQIIQMYEKMKENNRQIIQNYEEVKEIKRRMIQMYEEMRKKGCQTMEEIEEMEPKTIKKFAKMKEEVCQMIEEFEEVKRKNIEEMEESVIIVALGAGSDGVFSNDDELWSTLNKVGYVTGDRVCRMLLYRLYRKQIAESILANFNNITGSSYIRSCVAAAFLQEIVNSDTKWMHVDIDEVYNLHHEIAASCQMIEEVDESKRRWIQLYEDIKKNEREILKENAERKEKVRQMIEEVEEKIRKLIKEVEKISRKVTSLAARGKHGVF